MKPNPAQKIIQITWRLLTILALLGAGLFGSKSAMAQSTFTWNGGSGTTGNWTDAANWGGTAPATPQNFLNFNNSTRLTNTNNFAGGSAGFQIYFKSGAGAFNLFGNSISFFDFSSVDPNIQNEGTVTTQTINFPIVNGNTHGVNGILNINLNASPAQGPLVFSGSISNADATIAVRALNVSGGSPVRFNGVLSDFSSSGKLALTQLGAGTTTLAATNTYTGATTISAGALTIAGSGVLGSGSYAGAISIASGAVLEYAGTNAQTLSGAITGAGALTKSGAFKSDLTLSSTLNTYNGITTITNGRIVVTAPSNLSAGATTIVQTNGGQIFLNVASQTFSNAMNISSTGYPEGDALSNVDGAIRDEGSTLAGTITLSGNSRIGNFATGNTNLISGQITGAYGIDFYGMNAGNSVNHLFALSNPGNNYSGVTTIYNRDYGTAKTSCATTLRLGASGAIPSGASAGNLAFNGADANHLTILDLFGFNQTINGTTVTAASGARITNSVGSASVLTIGTNNTSSTFNGLLCDGGIGSANTLAITKIGSGTLILSSANAHSGPTINSAGTLEADNSAALGAGLLVMNGGALSNSASSTLTNNINLAVASTIGVGTSQTLTLGGVITNTGSLTMVGAGNLILTNANNYSGGTFANGTVYMKNNLCFGTGTVTVNAGGQAYNAYNPGLSFTITNSVTLNGGQLHTGGGQSGTKITWSGTVTLTASSSMSSDGGTTGNAFAGGLNLGNSGYTLTVNGNGPNDGFNANNFNSVISGGPNATFQVGSSGVAYLNAANTFSGTNRSGFSLVLKNVNALQNATLDMNAADNGSVTLINNAVIGALTGSRNLNLSVAAISIGNNNTSTTYTGALTNTGSLTKIGSGTLTLSGANTYSGNTTISAGTLALSGSGTLASPNITVAGGATFDVSALSSTFTLASGQKLANSGATTATLNGSADASVGKVTLAYASGTPSLKVTSGTLTLSASTIFTVSNTGSILQAGTYTNILANGGTVAAGTLPAVVMTGNGAVGSASLSIDGGGNLLLTVQNTGWTGAVGTFWTTAGNWSSGTVPSPGDPINFNSSSTANLNTVLNTNFGISTLTVTVPTGSVSIAAGGAYTLSITNGINLASATQDLTMTAPLALGASQTWSVTNTHTLSVNGGVSGSAALTLSGGGKVSLGGAATYTGDTTVSAGGTLQLGADNVLPNVAGGGNLNVSGVLDLNGHAGTVNGLNGSGVVDNTAIGAATLTVGSNHTNSSFSGKIQNTGGTLALVKTGTGTLTLNSTNTYSGGTLIANGIVVPSNGSVFGTGTVTNSGTAYPVTTMTITNPLVLNGGYLRVGGGSTTVNWTGPVTVTNGFQMSGDNNGNVNTVSGSINIGTGGIAVTNNTGNGQAQAVLGDILSGTISGSGGITYYCSGGNSRLTVQGANTYSGGTIVNGTGNGKLNVSGGLNPFSTGTVTLNAGAVIEAYPGNVTITNALNLNGGILEGESQYNDYNRLTWAGPITLTANSTLYQFGQNSGQMSQGLNVSGSLNMNGYTLTNSGNSGLFSGSIISGPISGTGTILETVNILYLQGSNTFSGTIRPMGGNITVQNVNAIQNATLDMNAADSGSVTLMNGAVIGALTGSRNLNLGGFTLLIGNNNSSTNYSGALTNTGSFTKVGTGTLTLSGANTYPGNTTISGGTLALSGSGSLASSVIAVAGGATLDASAGSFTLGAGQILSNTASATAQLVGPLSSGSGTLSVSFVNGTPSFNVTGGALTLSAATVVAVRNTGAALAPGTYKIISASGSGSVSGTAPTSVSVINGPAAGTPSIAIVGGELYLTVGGTSVISYTGTGPFTYSGTAQGPTVNFTGSTNTLASAYVGVSVSYGPSVNAPTNVGTYYLSNTVAADANYLGATNSQSFTINAAALGITANNTNKSYGQTVTFVGTEFTSSGLVGGDSVSSVTLTSVGATNTATVGSYAIVASAAVGSGLVNYTITYTNGTLTVNPATTSVGVSSTANPSGYKDSVAFIATLPTDASGSVIFFSTNGAISTNSVSSGSATSSSVTNLLRGTNVITIAYLGDPNYLGSTNYLNQLVTNHPPVVNNVSYARSAGLNTFKIAVTNLVSNASDADGDSLTLVSVGATTNSAFAMIRGGFVLYYNTNAVADEFSYSVSDGFGGTNSATVTIGVDTTPLFGQSQIVSTGGGTATLNFAGIPGYSYSVSRSTNLVDWAAIWTTNAPAGGSFEFIDTSAPSPSAYYRLQYNP